MLPVNISKRYATSPSVLLVKNINYLENEILAHENFQRFKCHTRDKHFPCTNTTPTTHLKIPLKNAKYLNRMRTGLILKSHMFSHNFTDVLSPSCRCGSRTQNEKHFFLECTYWTITEKNSCRVLSQWILEITLLGFQNHAKLTFYYMEIPILQL